MEFVNTFCRQNLSFPLEFTCQFPVFPGRTTLCHSFSVTSLNIDTVIQTPYVCTLSFSSRCVKLCDVLQKTATSLLLLFSINRDLRYFRCFTRSSFFSRAVQLHFRVQHWRLRYPVRSLEVVASMHQCSFVLEGTG